MQGKVVTMRTSVNSPIDVYIQLKNFVVYRYRQLLSREKRELLAFRIAECEPGLDSETHRDNGMSQRKDSISYPTPTTGSITAPQQATIQEAIGILESSFKRFDALTSSRSVRDFCLLQLAGKRDEHFACLYLDNQHRLISFETLFTGTIDGAAVYPRVVVRRALELNTAAVIFTHNHPSGLPEPSQADLAITRRLKEALGPIEIRVLDHIVVGAEGSVSMAERGML